MDPSPGDLEKHSARSPYRLPIIAAMIALWLAMRIVFWVGYVGFDDFFYADYAYRGDRQPTVHFECRLPYIWAVRACYRLLGPTELAVCLPGLAGSAMIFAATAGLVDWPRRMTPQVNYAMLLICVMPLDVQMATNPLATVLSAGLLALGTAALIAGGSFAQICGGVLLALGVFNHVLMVYYAGILCIVLLLYDWRKYLLPVIVAGALTVALFAAQGLYYGMKYDDPLLRVQLSMYYASGDVDLNKRAGGSRASFYLLPLQYLFDYRLFAFALPVGLIGGPLVWSRLERNQRLLLVMAICYFLWLGYGTVVPWRYKPITRGIHYYNTLVMPAAVLAPAVLWRIERLLRRTWLPHAIACFLLAIAVFGLADRGVWSQWFDVSRELYTYAKAHPDETFLTDFDTYNAMYILNGFNPPKNVACLNSAKADEELLVNRWRGDKSNVRFDEPPPPLALLNTAWLATGRDEAFCTHVRNSQWGIREQFAPEYRWTMLPLVWINQQLPREPGVFEGLGPGRWRLRNYGGAVARRQTPSAQSDEQSRRTTNDAAP